MCAAKATAQNSVNRSPRLMEPTGLRVSSAPIPAVADQKPKNLGNPRLDPIDERSEQRYHHGRQARHERGFGRGGEAQAQGLKQVAEKQKDAGERRPGRALRQRPAAREWLAKEQPATRTVAREKRRARNRSGETSAERRFYQDERGAPDEGVEDQRQFRRGDSAVAGGAFAPAAFPARRFPAQTAAAA